MRNRWIVGAIVAAVAATSVGGASAYGSGGSETAKRLRLLDVSGEFAFVDADPPAASENDVSPGDEFVFENTLRERRSGATVGTFDSICSALVSAGLVLCRGTIALNGGTIQVATEVDFADAERIVAAVTGGTGRYRKAHGELVLGEQVSDGVRELTLTLLP